MNEGETGGSPIALPAEMVVRSAERGEDRAPLPWLSILEAALLHALILLWLFVNWSHPPPLPAEPQPIPVRLVLAPPPKPAAAPATPKPTPLTYRESGPDQETRAPPPAEVAAREAATPPPAAPDLTNPEKPVPPPPPEKPMPEGEMPSSAARAKPVAHKQVARLEPSKKDAPTLQGPRLAPLRRLDIAPGKHAETGDPYLNRLQALIEAHRVYPHIIGQFGLPVEGTAVFDVALDRSGQVIGLRLAQSSGVPGIDKDVETMIRSSLPFPPLPPGYPDRVGIVVGIRLFPRS